MLIEERLSRIQEILEAKKSASIDYLAVQLKVSKDTIRRDLIKLEKQEIVKRIHGGAMLANREAMIFNYQERAGKDQVIKERIAKKAAQLIKNNAAVLMDSSTSVEAIIPFLHDKGILAITNSLSHASLLTQIPSSEVRILPGKVHKQQLFIYGAETVDKIRDYFVDYSFLGVFAINADGMFIHTEEEGLVKRQMLLQSKQTIALADHTKLDTTGLFKISSLKELDILITDQEPSSDFLTALEQNHVELILV
ncbi:DeoR/GlpR family DNA-binding transcription regulator [Enterococcus florum]|nr:DeoR/GlpR family DNA-binding transcription regulator [Enterococcus florum]